MKIFALLIALLLAFSVVQATSTDALDTIEGILVGAFAEHGKAAMKCIEDGEESFIEIEEAIKEFAKGGTTNIIQGLFLIGKALEKLPDEMKDCESAEEILGDFEHIIAEFKDPSALVIHVGKEVMWHGKSIYNDITGAVSNFKEGQFKPAGLNIGDIIHILLVQTDLKSPAKDTLDTVEGILVGAFGADGKAAVVCLDDGEEIFDDVEKAIKEFEQGGVTHIVQGLFYIGQALEELPKEFQGCQEAEGLFDDFEKIVEEFKNPQELIVHITKEVIWHGKTITHDITGAKDHFNNGEFEPAGENIGDLVKILLIDSIQALIKNSL